MAGQKRGNLSWFRWEMFELIVCNEKLNRCGHHGTVQCTSYLCMNKLSVYSSWKNSLLHKENVNSMGIFHWLKNVLHENDFIIISRRNRTSLLLFKNKQKLLNLKDNFMILQHRPYLDMFLYPRDNWRQKALKLVQYSLLEIDRALMPRSVYRSCSSSVKSTYCFTDGFGLF